MVKTLTKHGDEFALIIDRPILELLKINEDTELDVSTNGNALIITPVDSQVADSGKFEACLDRVVTTRRSVLENLAK